MRQIIHGIRYDTDTATEIMTHEWKTHHPNWSGGEPWLKHQRGVYRGKNGGLFGHAYDDIPYNRERNGATGAFVKHTASITPFENEEAALIWAEEQGFTADQLDEAFDEVIADA